MATHDYVIDNSTGANVRSDINSVLQAILTNNSSSSAPSTTAAYMWWADTTTGILKIRNSSDNGWVELLQLDGTLTIEDGSASTPGLAFRDDLNTGIYQDTNDELRIATGGTERLSMGGANTIFNETGADVDFRIEGDSTANLFVCDAGNNRVGIGTANPRRLFHIHEAASATVGLMLTNGATGESNDSQGFQFKVASDSTALIEQRENAAIKFGINGNDAMMIDTSRRLLIGKTSGSFSLDVAAGSSSVLRLTNTLESSHGSHDANIVAGGTYYQNLTLQQRSFKVQTFNDSSIVNGFTLTPNQKALFGTYFSETTSGGANCQLQVQGTDHNTSGILAARFAADDGGPRLSFLKSRSSSGGGVTKLNENDTCGSIFWVGANNNDLTNGFMAALDVQADAVQGGADTPGRMRFFTTPDGSSTLQERMRITSGGNVLINTTTAVGGSNPQLQVVDTTDAEIFIGNTHTNANGHCNITFGPSNGVSTAIIRGYAIEDASSSAAQTGGLKFFVREDGNFKESFRLNREGSINVAESGDSNTAKLDVVHSGNNGGGGVPTYVCRFYQATNNTGVDHANIQSRHNAALSGQNGVAIDFKNNGGSTTGSIVQGNSSVGYNTSSDYRLKENIVNITDGITRIKQLSPKRFNFIADTTNTLQDGFIAHEVTPVIPEAVTGVKDATYTTYYDNFDTIPEGKAIGDVKEEAAINPQSLDYAKFTPLLTAALQEAIAKIEVLETKVAALEAA